MKGLYIHIPFCAHKCGYCDFTSFVPKKDEIDDYISAIEIEFEMYREELSKGNIRTIFIGGGTPSILSVSQLENLFNVINKNIDVSGIDEYTIECNPGTLTFEKLKVMRANGVNRLSMGLQAIQERHLRFMERIHSLKDFDNNFENARKAGFDNINVDLIYAYDGLTMDEWLDSIEYVAKKGVEHISCYSLIIEENTSFYNKYLSGEIVDVDEDLFVEMYRKTIEVLSKYGIEQYEISNYSKAGYECKHNINYWECGEYIGIGLSASGFVNGQRYTNTDDMDKYLHMLSLGEKPISFSEHISNIDMYNEIVMLGLRTNIGIKKSIIEMVNDIDKKKRIESIIEFYIEKGYIQVYHYKEVEMLSLTQIGREVANSIIVDLMI